jgi:hypothetical protein
MSEARSIAEKHGWIDRTGSLACDPAEPFSTAIQLQLGYLWFGLPMVSYTYAELCFDSKNDRLKSIKIHYPIDAV